MALQDITTLVKHRLPFLHADYDAKIESFKTESFYFLQKYFGKDDNDVETESTYKPLERMLVADLTAYNLIVSKAIEMTGGNGSTAPATKTIKRAKADVVETEFMNIKASDGTFIQLETGSLLQEIRRALCDKAAALGIGLPMCSLATADTAALPFIFVAD